MAALGGVIERGAAVRLVAVVHQARVAGEQGGDRLNVAARAGVVDGVGERGVSGQ
jgi:hypothetical protein